MSGGSDTEYFYDDRIKNFDEERLKMTQYINLIKPNQRELHILQWEGRQQDENANILDHEILAYDEELQRINYKMDEARIELQNSSQKHIAQKVQIQRLNELSQPVQRDTTYLFDDKYSYTAPIDTKKKGKINTLLPSQKNKDTKNEPSNVVPTHLKSFKQQKTGEIVRIEGKLNDETKKLKSKYHDFQTLVHSVEGSIFENKENSNRLLETSRYEASRLISDNDRLDHQCYLSVSELLKLRLRIMIAQREEVEELDKLNEEKIDCEKSEIFLRNQLISDIQELRDNLKKDLEGREIEFSGQIEEVSKKCEKLKKKKNLELSNKKNLRSTKIIEKLEIDVAYAQERYERLRRRNVLEMEGYNNEATMLRLRLSHIEKVYSARKRRISSKGKQVRDSPRSPLDVSPISESIGYDRWT